MSQPKSLSEIFRNELKPLGFKQKADTWYRENEQVVQVLNIDKADFTKCYYVNIALWLKALGPLPIPKEHLCHVRDRWEEVMPQIDRKYLEKLLDLNDTSIGEHERAVELSRLLQTYIIPFFLQMDSLSAIQQAYQTKSLPLRMIVVKAQTLLSKEAATK